MKQKLQLNFLPYCDVYPSERNWLDHWIVVIFLTVNSLLTHLSDRLQGTGYCPILLPVHVIKTYMLLQGRGDIIWIMFYLMLTLKYQSVYSRG